MQYSDYQPGLDCQIAGLQGVLAGVLGLRDDGMFVEVGAHDGKSWSNTYQLACAGWRGIYIEPISELYQRCVENHSNHPNVICVQAFVAAEDDEAVAMYLTDGIYTGDLTFVHGNRQPLMVAQTRKLDSILAEHSVIRRAIDLLVIDVEGYEPHVLSGFSIDHYLPHLVIIEAHRYHSDPRYSKNAGQIGQYFIDHGYVRIYADAINDIYLVGGIL